MHDPTPKPTEVAVLEDVHTMLQTVDEEMRDIPANAPLLPYGRLHARVEESVEVIQRLRDEIDYYRRQVEARSLPSEEATALLESVDDPYNRPRR